MPARLYALRVKIKSLGAEARIIRHEECKFPSKSLRKRYRRLIAAANEVAPMLPLRHTISGAVARYLRQADSPVKFDRAHPHYIDLHHHRTVDVRREARAAQLAYAFLRHRPYKNVEPNTPLIGQLVGSADCTLRMLNTITSIAARFGTITDPATVRAQIESWIDPQLTK